MAPWSKHMWLCAARSDRWGPLAILGPSWPPRPQRNRISHTCVVLGWGRGRGGSDSAFLLQESAGDRIRFKGTCPQDLEKPSLRCCISCCIVSLDRDCRFGFALLLLPWHSFLFALSSFCWTFSELLQSPDSHLGKSWHQPFILCSLLWNTY